MKKFVASVLAVLTAGGALAFDVNKDLKNLGGPAKGICVELCGKQAVEDTYDGYPSGSFDPPTVSTNAAGNTVICWSGFKDGDNNTIDPGEVVHVGWTTEAGNSEICDMYYTDGSGTRLPDSKIENIIPKFPEAGQGILNTEWGNFNSTHQILIQNVSFLVVGEPLPLADLNYLNEPLNAAMIPLPGGSFPLAPGQAMQLQVPPVPPGGAVILRYNVWGPGSSTEAIDFVQWTNQPSLACQWDLDGDGVVGQGDLGIVLAGYGTLYNQGHLGALLSVYGQPCP